MLQAGLIDNFITFLHQVHGHQTVSQAPVLQPPTAATADGDSPCEFAPHFSLDDDDNDGGGVDGGALAEGQDEVSNPQRNDGRATAAEDGEEDAKGDGDEDDEHEEEEGRIHAAGTTLLPPPSRLYYAPTATEGEEEGSESGVTRDVTVRVVAVAAAAPVEVGDAAGPRNEHRAGLLFSDSVRKLYARHDGSACPTAASPTPGQLARCLALSPWSSLQSATEGNPFHRATASDDAAVLDQFLFALAKGDDLPPSSLSQDDEAAPAAAAEGDVVVVHKDRFWEIVTEVSRCLWKKQCESKELPQQQGPDATTAGAARDEDEEDGDVVEGLVLAGLQRLLESLLSSPTMTTEPIDLLREVTVFRLLHVALQQWSTTTTTTAATKTTKKNTSNDKGKMELLDRFLALLSAPRPNGKIDGEDHAITTEETVLVHPEVLLEFTPITKDDLTNKNRPSSTLFPNPTAGSPAQQQQQSQRQQQASGSSSWRAAVRLPPFAQSLRLSLLPQQPAAELGGVQQEGNSLMSAVATNRGVPQADVCVAKTHFTRTTDVSKTTNNKNSKTTEVGLFTWSGARGGAGGGRVIIPPGVTRLTDESPESVITGNDGQDVIPTTTTKRLPPVLLVYSTNPDVSGRTVSRCKAQLTSSLRLSCSWDSTHRALQWMVLHSAVKFLQATTRVASQQQGGGQSLDWGCLVTAGMKEPSLTTTTDTTTTTATDPSQPLLERVLKMNGLGGSSSNSSSSSSWQAPLLTAVFHTLSRCCGNAEAVATFLIRSWRMQYVAVLQGSVNERLRDQLLRICHFLCQHIAATTKVGDNDDAVGLARPPLPSEASRTLLDVLAAQAVTTATTDDGTSPEDPAVGSTSFGEVTLRLTQTKDIVERMVRVVAVASALLLREPLAAAAPAAAAGAVLASLWRSCTPSSTTTTDDHRSYLEDFQGAGNQRLVNLHREASSLWRALHDQGARSVALEILTSAQLNARQSRWILSLLSSAVHDDGTTARMSQPRHQDPHQTNIAGPAGGPARAGNTASKLHNNNNNSLITAPLIYNYLECSCEGVQVRPRGLHQAWDVERTTSGPLTLRAARGWPVPSMRSSSSYRGGGGSSLAYYSETTFTAGSPLRRVLIGIGSDRDVVRCDHPVSAEMKHRVWYVDSNRGEAFVVPFGIGDTVGCGIVASDASSLASLSSSSSVTLGPSRGPSVGVAGNVEMRVFFTLNGVLLYERTVDLTKVPMMIPNHSPQQQLQAEEKEGVLTKGTTEGKEAEGGWLWFPFVATDTTEKVSFTVNFGQSDFLFDYRRMMVRTAALPGGASPSRNPLHEEQENDTQEEQQARVVARVTLLQRLLSASTTSPTTQLLVAETQQQQREWQSIFAQILDAVPIGGPSTAVIGPAQAQLMTSLVQSPRLTTKQAAHLIEMFATGAESLLRPLLSPTAPTITDATTPLSVREVLERVTMRVRWIVLLLGRCDASRNSNNNKLPLLLTTTTATLDDNTSGRPLSELLLELDRLLAEVLVLPARHNHKRGGAAVTTFPVWKQATTQTVSTSGAFAWVRPNADAAENDDDQEEVPVGYVLGPEIRSSGRTSFAVTIQELREGRAGPGVGRLFIGVTSLDIPTLSTSSWRAATASSSTTTRPTVWAVHSVSSSQLPHCHDEAFASSLDAVFHSSEVVTIHIDREEGTLSMTRAGRSTLTNLFTEIPTNAVLRPFVQLVGVNTSVTMLAGSRQDLLTSSSSSSSSMVQEAEDVRVSQLILQGAACELSRALLHHFVTSSATGARLADLMKTRMIMTTATPTESASASSPHREEIAAKKRKLVEQIVGLRGDDRVVRVDHPVTGAFRAQLHQLLVSSSSTSMMAVVSPFQQTTTRQETSSLSSSALLTVPLEWVTRIVVAPAAAAAQGSRRPRVRLHTSWKQRGLPFAAEEDDEESDEEQDEDAEGEEKLRRPDEEGWALLVESALTQAATSGRSLVLALQFSRAEREQRQALLDEERAAWDATILTPERHRVYLQLLKANSGMLGAMIQAPSLPKTFTFVPSPSTSRMVPGAVEVPAHTQGRLMLSPTSVSAQGPFFAKAAQPVQRTGITNVRVRVDADWLSLLPHAARATMSPFTYIGLCTRGYNGEALDHAKQSTTTPYMWAISSFDRKDQRLPNCLFGVDLTPTTNTVMNRDADPSTSSSTPRYFTNMPLIFSRDVIRLRVNRTLRTIEIFRTPFTGHGEEIALGMSFIDLPEHGDLFPFVQLGAPRESAMFLPESASIPRAPQNQLRYATTLTSRDHTCNGCLTQYVDTKVTAPDWYRCNECTDYDLCGTCFQNHVHAGHTFTHMRTVSFAPSPVLAVTASNTNNNTKQTKGNTSIYQAGSDYELSAVPLMLLRTMHCSSVSTSSSTSSLQQYRRCDVVETSATTHTPPTEDSTTISSSSLRVGAAVWGIVKRPNAVTEFQFRLPSFEAQRATTAYVSPTAAAVGRVAVGVTLLKHLENKTPDELLQLIQKSTAASTGVYVLSAATCEDWLPLTRSSLAPAAASSANQLVHATWPGHCTVLFSLQREGLVELRMDGVTHDSAVTRQLWPPHEPLGFFVVFAAQPPSRHSFVPFHGRVEGVGEQETVVGRVSEVSDPAATSSSSSSKTAGGAPLNMLVRISAGSSSRWCDAQQLHVPLAPARHLFQLRIGQSVYLADREANQFQEATVFGIDAKEELVMVHDGTFVRSVTMSSVFLPLPLTKATADPQLELDAQHPFPEAKQRLRRFYAVYAPTKTEAEMDNAIEKYSKSAKGLAGMWKDLVTKYGPEPSGAPVAPKKKKTTQTIRNGGEDEAEESDLLEDDMNVAFVASGVAMSLRNVLSSWSFVALALQDSFLKTLVRRMLSSSSSGSETSSSSPSSTAMFWEQLTEVAKLFRPITTTTSAADTRSTTSAMSSLETIDDTAASFDEIDVLAVAERHSSGAPPPSPLSPAFVLQLRTGSGRALPIHVDLTKRTATLRCPDVLLSPSPNAFTQVRFTVTRCIACALTGRVTVGLAGDTKQDTTEELQEQKAILTEAMSESVISQDGAQWSRRAVVAPLQADEWIVFSGVCDVTAIGSPVTLRTTTPTTTTTGAAEGRWVSWRGAEGRGTLPLPETSILASLLVSGTNPDNNSNAGSRRRLRLPPVSQPMRSFPSLISTMREASLFLQSYTSSDACRTSLWRNAVSSLATEILVPFLAGCFGTSSSSSMATTTTTGKQQDPSSSSSIAVVAFDLYGIGLSADRFVDDVLEYLRTRRRRNGTLGRRPARMVHDAIRALAGYDDNKSGDAAAAAQNSSSPVQGRWIEGLIETLNDRLDAAVGSPPTILRANAHRHVSMALLLTCAIQILVATTKQQAFYNADVQRRLLLRSFASIVSVAHRHWLHDVSSLVYVKTVLPLVLDAFSTSTTPSPSATNNNKDVIVRLLAPLYECFSRLVHEGILRRRSILYLLVQILTPLSAELHRMTTTTTLAAQQQNNNKNGDGVASSSKSSALVWGSVFPLNGIRVLMDATQSLAVGHPVPACLDPSPAADAAPPLPSSSSFSTSSLWKAVGVASKFSAASSRLLYGTVVSTNPLSVAALPRTTTSEDPAAGLSTVYIEVDLQPNTRVVLGLAHASNPWIGATLSSRGGGEKSGGVDAVDLLANVQPSVAVLGGRRPKPQPQTQASSASTSSTTTTSDSSFGGSFGFDGEHVLVNGRCVRLGPFRHRGNEETIGMEVHLRTGTVRFAVNGVFAEGSFSVFQDETTGATVALPSDDGTSSDASSWAASWHVAVEASRSRRGCAIHSETGTAKFPPPGCRMLHAFCRNNETAHEVAARYDPTLRSALIANSTTTTTTEKNTNVVAVVAHDSHRVALQQLFEQCFPFIDFQSRSAGSDEEPQRGVEAAAGSFSSSASSFRVQDILPVLKHIFPSSYRKTFERVPALLPGKRGDIPLLSVRWTALFSSEPTRARDHALRQSVLGQLYAQLGGMRGFLSQSKLRDPLFTTALMMTDSGHVPIDAGGPYSQVWSLLSEELMADKQSGVGGANSNQAASTTTTASEGGNMNTVGAAASSTFGEMQSRQQSTVAAEAGTSSSSSPTPPPSSLRYFHRNPLFSLALTRKGRLLTLDPLACSQASPLELDLLQFFGAVLGYLVRAKRTLAVELSPLIWRYLCHEAITVEDVIAGLDPIYGSMLERPERLCGNAGESAAADDEDQDDLSSELHVLFPNLRAVAQSLLQQQQQQRLSLDGASTTDEATRRRRHAAYQQAAVHIVTTRLEPALSALRRGLELLLPFQFTCLLTTTEFEKLCCGDPFPTLEQVQQNVTVSLPEPYRGMFWQAMTQLTPSEWSSFFYFASAQKRCPLPRPISVTPTKQSEAHLPQASTCFSHVSVPLYSNVETWVKKLREAIKCVDMELA